MSEGLLKVYRSEWKYYISHGEYFYLKELLENVMTKDPNMKKTGQYYIRSLYFDSLDNIDYMTKINGLENRKKIRLRIYDTNTDKVKLEIKNRFNSYMLKESLTIGREDALSMIHGDFSVLDRYDREEARKAQNIMTTGLYSPKVIVDYDREASIYPEHNVRVTFEKSIRAGCSDAIFEKNCIFLSIKFFKATSLQLLIGTFFTSIIIIHIAK